VSPDRLGTFKGSLDGTELAGLDRALMLELGLL
jgi:mRNA interferase MazF